MSAYLFILALEVMLIQIRKDDTVRGITIGDTVITLSAYADDNYFFGITNMFVKVTLAYITLASAKGINKINDNFNNSGTLLHWKDAIDRFKLQPSGSQSLTKIISHVRLLRGILLSYII